MGKFIIPTDFHIFQRGRLNHQPVMVFQKLLGSDKEADFRTSPHFSVRGPSGTPDRWQQLVPRLVSAGQFYHLTTPDVNGISR